MPRCTRSPALTPPPSAALGPQGGVLAWRQGPPEAAGEVFVLNLGPDGAPAGAPRSVTAGTPAATGRPILAAMRGAERGVVLMQGRTPDQTFQLLVAGADGATTLGATFGGVPAVGPWRRLAATTAGYALAGEGRYLAYSLHLDARGVPSEEARVLGTAAPGSSVDLAAGGGREGALVVWSDRDAVTVRSATVGGGAASADPTAGRVADPDLPRRQPRRRGADRARAGGHARSLAPQLLLARGRAARRQRRPAARAHRARASAAAHDGRGGDGHRLLGEPSRTRRVWVGLHDGHGDRRRDRGVGHRQMRDGVCCPSSASQTALAWTGNGGVLVDDFGAYRLDPAGHPVGPRIVGVASSVTRAVASPDGAVLIVGAEGEAVYARRLGRDGTLLDPAGVAVRASGVSPNDALQAWSCGASCWVVVAADGGATRLEVADGALRTVGASLTLFPRGARAAAGSAVLLASYGGGQPGVTIELRAAALTGELAPMRADAVVPLAGGRGLDVAALAPTRFALAYIGADPRDPLIAGLLVRMVDVAW